MVKKTGNATFDWGNGKVANELVKALQRDATVFEQVRRDATNGMNEAMLATFAKHAGIKQIWDLSATPFYLSGSGYNEGYIFPWTVSDFSLMDAIEAGIVKVPRTPVDDNADEDLVTYLRLWDYVGPLLPKRAAKDTVKDWLKRWTAEKE